MINLRESSGPSLFDGTVAGSVIGTWSVVGNKASIKRYDESRVVVE